MWIATFLHGLQQKRTLGYIGHYSLNPVWGFYAWPGQNQKNKTKNNIRYLSMLNEKELLKSILREVHCSFRQKEDILLVSSELRIPDHLCPATAPALLGFAQAAGLPRPPREHRAQPRSPTATAARNQAHPLERDAALNTPGRPMTFIRIDKSRSCYYLLWNRP